MNLAQMLLREPALVAMWMILLVLTGPALVVLASPEGVRRPGQALRDAAGTLRRHRGRRTRRRQRAADVTRFAGELSVAAAHATTAAQRWHERWQQAHQHLDSAWQAWQDAETRLARSRAAAAFPLSVSGDRTDAAHAGERFLCRAVLAAARRGELPMSTVADALAGRDGWDPRLHPADQELRVQRAIAEHLAGRYRAAAAAERVTWHDAQLAAATRDSLRAEAAAVLAAPAPKAAQPTAAPPTAAQPTAAQPTTAQPTAARSAAIARAA